MVKDPGNGAAENAQQDGQQLAEDTATQAGTTDGSPATEQEGAGALAD